LPSADIEAGLEEYFRWFRSICEPPRLRKD